MTRINADIPPSELHRVHLIAELHEITMVPASLRRSLRTILPEKILKSVPEKFTLNAGHVKFFYPRLQFLRNRFHRLADEMERRGHRADRSRSNAFMGFDSIWYNDWASSQDDDNIVRVRIAQRIAEKPHLYKQTN